MDKYKYNDALKLLKNAHESNIKVTYKDIEDVLGLEYPIDGKKHVSTNNSALYELRKRLKNQYGLTFKSAASSWHSGPDYHYYIISKVKDGNFKKKNNEEAVKIVQEKIKNNQYEALSKNNQKLYAENQKLKLEYQEMQEKMKALVCREEEYKNIINSLMVITNII